MKKKSPKSKKEVYKYEFAYSVLKSSEGGPGTATLKSAFKKKREGIKVEFCASPYVGHTAYIVRATTVAKLREAFKTLKSYGYVTSWKYFLSNATFTTR